MTRKVADSLVRTIPDTIVGGDLEAGDSLPAIDEMVPCQMAAISGTDGDFRYRDGIVERMRGDLRRGDGFAAQRPISRHIEAVKKAWAASARAGNLRGGNAVESGTGARRIGRTNT